MTPAFAVWMTGLPASGKSTITRALARELALRGVHVAVLESDVLRQILTPRATYTTEERDTFYRAVAAIGSLLVTQGVPVIFDATANRRAHRTAARSAIPRFIEVYVHCPFDVCAARDPKGIYERAGSGRASNVPGLQTPYEPPDQPDVVVSGTADDRAAARAIVEALQKKGYVPSDAVEPSASPAQQQEGSVTMPEIRQILCPVDFSETSRRALQHAVAIARWYQSRVVALHVMPARMVLLPPLPAANDVGSAPASASERRTREDALRQWLEPADRAGLRTDVVVDEGDAASRIVELATSRDVDLVVMGTHGLSGFERLVLGSVAEKVLRKVTSPLLTVPPASDAMAKVPYTRLLCPVDFSESSLAALEFAFSIAEEADAKLTLLHVVEWPADNDLVTQRFDVSEFRRSVGDDASARLEALVPDDVRVWCKPSTAVVYGKAHDEIVSAAEREGTDLIVMGVRGRNALDLAVFGSTTNQVVRRASCPVLTLRP